MRNLVFGSAERPGNSADAAEIPVVRDNDVAIGQEARPTERPEKASAAARHRIMPNSNMQYRHSQFMALCYVSSLHHSPMITTLFTSKQLMDT